MEIMQPPSKLKTLAAHSADNSEMEPPTKMQAIELPEGESDDEYEAVPKKARKTSPPRITAAPLPVATSIVAPEEKVDEVMVEPTAPAATDNDWLRSRTNRLLDLMEPEDILATGSGGLPTTTSSEVTEITTVAQPPSQDSEPIVEEVIEEEEKPDPVIEAIKSNGRLFVRNLPYSATEDDLRAHFAPFGALEEVWFYLLHFVYLLHAL